jgi:hypothetical protein
MSRRTSPNLLYSLTRLPESARCGRRVESLEAHQKDGGEANHHHNSFILNRVQRYKTRVCNSAERISKYRQANLRVIANALIEAGS